MRTSDLVRKLAASLAPQTGRIARTITERVRTEIPEVRGITEPAFWQAVEDGTRANLDAGLAMIAGGGDTPRDSPLDASFVARMVATQGVSLSTLLRAYRIGHRVGWEEWARAVEELDVAVDDRTAALAHGASMLFDYVDRVAQLISEEYSHELDAAIRDREQRRLQRVRDLVDGAAIDTRDLEYDLALEHVAIVADGGAAQAEPALRAVAGELDLRLLLVQVEPGTTWAWFGGRELDQRPWREVIRLNTPEQVVLGIGDAAGGHGGFRASHHQARDAVRVGRRLGLAVCHFHDVALEALALRDEQFARRFVARELCGLDGQDDRSTKLRDTLRAYFASGHNAAAAAAMLDVHDQTVTYRLRRAEESIGARVSDRRAELELALRLERMLSPDDAADR